MRVSENEIQSMADGLLYASLSRNTSSASQTPVTLRRVPPNGSPDAYTLANGSTSAKSSTTSRTRERLRLLELERDELRHAVVNEQAVNKRLKEGRDVPELSGTEVELRVRKLQHDLRTVRANASQSGTTGLFKKACSTDLLFLIDATNSMKPYLEAAKNQVRSIIKGIEDTFYNEADVRIAVVVYRDHGAEPNVQFQDFTSSTHEARSFLNKIHLEPGIDWSEDVLGGIKQALGTTWMHETRCIIHIGDAPPHGRGNHDFEEHEKNDRYPDAGTEPYGLTYEHLLRQMASLKINYALLRINDYTDRMILNFSKIYAAAGADCKLHISNKYYAEASSQTARSYSLSRTTGSTTGSLIFEELEMGTSYNALQHLVQKVVTTSASRTASRLSRTSTFKSRSNGLKSNLGSIIENEAASTRVVLEDKKPEWERSGWLDETLTVEGFSPDIGTHGASTLNDMMASDDNIKMRITELILRKRSRPFAQGTMRTASYARTESSTNRFVVKSFKKSGKRLAHVAEDMQIQALCKAFALEFNSVSGERYAIDFLVTTCLKPIDVSDLASDEDCMSLEPFIEGTYVKYNSNSGYVNRTNPDDRFNEAAQAFSHFTFERSQGRFLVSDLQGSGYVLTDPAIHTLDRERFKLTETNLGKEGFKFFFATHECNSICRSLGLKSDRAMIKSGNYEFRKTWPRMDNTVCCSNKLCGKMLRLCIANKSRTFPDHNWCDSCFPQLEMTVVHRICVAPGPHHEFQVSKFFYESQGRRTPRRCEEHRDEDVLTPRTTTVNWNLWTKLKRVTRKNSVGSGMSPRRRISVASLRSALTRGGQT